jgi:uncharacterized protein
MVDDLDFEWDPDKARTNVIELGRPSFEQGAYVFEDPDCIEGSTSDPAGLEERFFTIGVVDLETLFVVYTWRGLRRRLISVRKASLDERQAYGHDL